MNDTPGSGSPLRRGDLRVANWNLMWRFADHARRMPLIVEHLRRVSADVVALQECSPEQVADIAETLGYESHYSGSPLGRGGLEMGNAVLSRYPIVEADHLWLPMTKAEDMRRVAVSARVGVGHGSVWITSVHLTRTPQAGGAGLGMVLPGSDESRARLTQINALASHGAKLEGPRIVAGDLAFLPDSVEYNAMSAIGLRDAWRLRARVGTRLTTPSDCPYLSVEMERYRAEVAEVGAAVDDVSFCIDYQFVDAEMLHSGLAWIFGRPLPIDPGLWPSDHLGLAVDYVLR